LEAQPPEQAQEPEGPLRVRVLMLVPESVPELLVQAGCPDRPRSLVQQVPQVPELLP